MIDTALTKEKAILIGVINQEQDEDKVREYLDELEFLVETADGIPVKRFVQKIDAPNPATYIGKGKVNQIERLCQRK